MRDARLLEGRRDDVDRARRGRRARRRSPRPPAGPGAPMPSSLVTRMRMPVPSSSGAPLLGSPQGGVQRRRRVHLRRDPVSDCRRHGGTRMRLEGREIAVVGAGIGGLAAAMALAQRRARVRVFEQAAALGEVGAGIQIAPNGVAVLEALGMRDAAEALGEPAAGGRARRPPARRGRSPACRSGRRSSPGTAGPTGTSTAPTCWRCSRRGAAEAGVGLVARRRR